MSPFDGRRFMLQEDSGVWSSAREQRGGPSKLLRFASTNSVASDKDEPVPPPPRQLSPKRSLFLPSVLAIIFLGLALWLLPLRITNITQARLFDGQSPSTCTHSGDYESFNPVLSPALKAAVEELVAATLRSHQMANRGLPDYALKAYGARIALSLTTKTHGFLPARNDDPSVAIDDDVHAGRCWAFCPHPSQIGVRLSRILRPSHVSIEHLPRDILIDVGETPRNMTLWGLVDGKNNTEIYHTLVASNASHHPRRAPSIAKGFLWAPLTSFAYDIHDDNPVQTFAISQQYVDSGITFGIVVLEVLDNWGSDSTCLYRMMVHGTPA